MYMPTTTAAATVAAPTTAYAAPATYAAPSFVAAPQTMVAAPTVAAPSFVAAPVAEVAYPGFAVPAPQSLTQGLVPPAKVEQERVAYERALAGQLDKQTKAVLEEAKIKKAMMEQTATTQIEEYKLQVNENFAMQCLQVDQEAQTMITGLKEAAITQQTAREEQAAIAVADFTLISSNAFFLLKS